MTTIRNNKLRVAFYAIEIYSLIAAEFFVKDQSITPGQPSDVQIGDTLRLDQNGEFDFRVGRQKSKSVADWFNAQCDTSKCTTFGHAAAELNFAFIGSLQFTVSYKSRKLYTIKFDDILIAQGQNGTVSDWWFGGKTCSRMIGRDKVESTGSTDNKDNFRFTFFRGGDTYPHAVVITTVNLLTWMKNIDDSRLLSQVNIAGTHDSGTYNFNALIFSNYVKTQNLSIRQQLDLGVRFLDIRCRHVNNTFQIHHGDYYVNLKFDDILRQCIAFLDQNDSETIVILVKEEGRPKWNNGAFYETFLDYVNGTREYWYRGNQIPSLKEARKKFILMYRFDFPESFFGIDCNEWSDNATFEIKRRTFTLAIQDEYDVTFERKKRSIRALVESSRLRENQYWYINYISLAPSFARGTIIDTSNYTNRVIYDIAATQHISFVGLVVMDYPNTRNGLVPDIIDLNFIIGGSSVSRLGDEMDEMTLSVIWPQDST